jgi:hypothetical protein
MTKVQVHYELLRPLGDVDGEGVANCHGEYGIMRVYVAPTLDRITVDYDASRLSEKLVESILIRNGVPIKRQPAVAGA